MKIVSKNSQSNTGQHPFGGCNRLFMHYRTIGSALMTYEDSERADEDLRAFQVSTVFVPVEVLESYLEDVLDPRKKDDALFIERDVTFFGSSQFFFLGMVASLSLGLFAMSAGASYFASLLLSLVAALPCVFAWQFHPTRSAVRRLRLARVLSKIISIRRGRDDSDEEMQSASGSFFARLVPPGTSSSGHGAAFNL